MKSYLSILSLILACGPLSAFASSSTPETQKVYFHLTFPVTIQGETETLVLNENYKDLILSNFVAGGLLAHLIHERFPKLNFDRQYIMGTLFAQLLQENLQTTDYQSSGEWINPNKDIRQMLLMPGQGGPYQLNDYSKRLEDKIGMINFKVLQKSLGYSILDQDSGSQTTKKGPNSLDDKYFGPIAAAYFHFNDMLRLEAINKDPWGPVANYYSNCMSNLEAQQNNFLDMILNATYNAGPWAEITKSYFELCANYSNLNYAEKIKHINDYQLDDKSYQQAIGTKESAGSTFILYPRQIRFYLDELYNNSTGLSLQNNMSFSLADLKLVFAKSMNTLAYSNKQNEYVFIDSALSNAAFDQALSDLHLSTADTLNLSTKNDREKFFDLIELSIEKISASLNVSFTEVTEVDYK